uniref:Uncharacterized protein n=1 Tax=viral metagenome TaxID=1070528 RepID=A0A6M3KZ97_9ZZZZ
MNKLEKLLVVGLVLSLLLSIVNFYMITVDRNENDERWDAQMKFDDTNIDLWEQQLDINRQMLDLIQTISWG